MKLITTFLFLLLFLFEFIGRDLLLMAEPTHDSLWDAPLATLVVEEEKSIDTTLSIIPVVLEKEQKENDTLHCKEWFPFEGFEYSLENHKWTERNKILFTNILKRESCTVTNRHQEIDQYLVAITAIRRYVEKYNKKKILVQKNVTKFVGAYRMEPYKKPKFKRNKKLNDRAWAQCYKVVNNVLNGTIPAFVPYIPHGTYAYLNSRLDTDKDWINSCETKYCVVASTYKDHHFYADPKAMTPNEIAHLKSNPHNPANKRFKDGIFANKIY